MPTPRTVTETLIITIERIVTRPDKAISDPVPKQGSNIGPINIANLANCSLLLYSPLTLEPSPKRNSSRIPFYRHLKPGANESKKKR